MVQRVVDERNQLAQKLEEYLMTPSTSTPTSPTPNTAENNEETSTPKEDWTMEAKKTWLCVLP